MRGAVGLVERVRGGAKRGDRSNSTRGPRVEDSPRQSRGASAPSFIVSDIDPRGGDEENSHGTSSHPHGELGTLSPADRAEHQKVGRRAARACFASSQSSRAPPPPPRTSREEWMRARRDTSRVRVEDERRALTMAIVRYDTLPRAS